MTAAMVDMIGGWWGEVFINRIRNAPEYAQMVEMVESQHGIMVTQMKQPGPVNGTRNLSKWCFKCVKGLKGPVLLPPYFTVPGSFGQCTLVLRYRVRPESFPKNCVYCHMLMGKCICESTGPSRAGRRRSATRSAKRNNAAARKVANGVRTTRRRGWPS
jgi:hypothetical protein